MLLTPRTFSLILGADFGTKRNVGRTSADTMFDHPLVISHFKDNVTVPLKPCIRGGVAVQVSQGDEPSGAMTTVVYDKAPPASNLASASCSAAADCPTDAYTHRTSVPACISRIELAALLTVDEC